jgi:hypothetical protein
MERFWSKVKVGLPQECWEWTAFKNQGYGWFSYNGRSMGAHVVAMELGHGVRPVPGYEVCHDCGNDGCCNPAHLRIDTPTGNAADRKRHGTEVSRPGETNPNARLTDAQVAAIRTKLAAGATQKSLAREYKVSRKLIFLILHRDYRVPIS